MLKHDLILSNYELDKLLPKKKNQKVITLMEDELGKKNHDKICWIIKKKLIVT